jgi:hypothetical protein
MNRGRPHVRSERIDEMLLVKYLLGNLTEDKQVQVEDRAFSDPDYLAALEAAEADLIDNYIRGDLSQSERRSFERLFLNSPLRRSKVEFARALARVAAESKLAGLVPQPSARPSLLAFLRGWNPALKFASAVAALIFIAAGSWLMVQNAVMRSRVAALEAQGRAIEAHEQALQRELLAQSQRPPVPLPATAPVPIIASLVFPPGLTRAETRREQLVLNPSAQLAHIEIQLEARDDYPRYRAELRTAGGEEVLTQGSLRKHRNSGGYSVTVDVPASSLAAGGYELALKGLPQGQSAVDIGYYYFSVPKQ